MIESPPRFNPDSTLSTTERAYVVRKFEGEMFDHLSSFRWVSLLGPRKYGKSSALVRVRETLVQGGFASAFIDMQRYGESSEDYGTFLDWFANALASDIGTTPEPPKTKRQRRGLEHWLTGAAAENDHANIVVLIDEASGVPQPLRHYFFSQLRAFFGARNTRPGTPEARLSNRMSFALAGTFRPSQIIEGPNSPFNIVEEVTPHDFTPGEVLQLAKLGLGADARHYADRAFKETEGQPYFVQHLFAKVQAAGNEAATRAAAFEKALHDLRAGVRGHTEDLIRMVDRDPELRALVPAILSGTVPFGGPPAHHLADTYGVARERGGHLVARNPIVASLLERYLQDGLPDRGGYPS